MGKKIKEKDEDLLKRLIFEIRGEETPGRFLEKLTNKMCEYRTNKNIALDIFVIPLLFKEKWQGDKFYYMKSAIMSAFTNALGGKENE